MSYIYIELEHLLFNWNNHTYNILILTVHTRIASTPGRPLEEGRPGIDCLRMREVSRILSSKFDRKLNYP